ncbi:MAG: GNAT family N-acetyltransferase [Bacteroidales bacterium]
MKIIQVADRKTIRQFHDVIRVIYKDDPNFVCPLDNDIEAIFDPSKNTFFNNGDACRWILKNDEGKLIGRVAAFYNWEKARKYEQPTGGMGFFECIDNQEAAFLLFDTCRDWLEKAGLQAMDGPVNFGENESYWGLLVEGFDNPSYGMNYHHPYYQKFFENYGFYNFFEQITNKLDLTREFPERFWKIADWIRQKPGFTYKHFEKKNAEKYLRDIKEVYDQAWVYHEHFTPIDLDILRKEFQKAKHILNEEFIWFAYHDNKPVAFLVMLPDANQILKYFNGRLSLLDKIRFLLLKRKDLYTKARITVMGVIPRFQRYGIESAIFWHMDKIMRKKPNYTEIELAWVGDFNPKMQRLHDAVESTFSKRHITYRKLFKPGTEKRANIII